MAEPKDYGIWTLGAAQLISLPLVDGKGQVDFFAAPPKQARPMVGNGNGGGGMKRARIAKRTLSANKKAMTTAPAPAPGPMGFNSVSVLNVGQGNCNLLIDNNNQPFLYYDVGYPLFFYTATAPANLNAGAAPPSGPIPQNTANTLRVVLSHWDWDHWRLARIWPALAALPWIVPVQPVGPAALNFFNNNLPNCTVVPPATPNTVPVGFITLYRAWPPPGAPAPMVMNNTGLALGVTTVLPLSLPNVYQVAITGDANFSSLPAPFPMAPNIAGITAVHHGSAAHGADQNLPVPAVPGGRVAYSCGETPAGYRPYGFPNPNALNNYRNVAGGGWAAPMEMDTPEGPNIRGALAQRNPGNIRIGRQIQLPNVPLYNGTAFYNYLYQLP
ncbi:MAG: hypothetical protein AUG49_20060 [Catenulispora sp. 13_1_20CM_3_70_7]|nr:MAG: hypothetical protein AUG49_20060 [Catenulispora sp. 13_1_20CM_3_70_7]